MAGEGGADGGKDNERHAGFIGQAIDPAPAVHVLENDQQAVGLALPNSLQKGGHRRFVLNRLFFLVQVDGEASAGAGQLPAVFLLPLVEVVSRAGPPEPVGPGLLQNSRVQADLGMGPQPGGVNEVRVCFA